MRLLALLGGGLLLVWPAFLNGYPLVFSDTGAFLHQTLGPLVIWDKPHVYGPLLHAFHWRLSLWGPLLAQGAMLSWLLWLLQRSLRGRATPWLHLLACAGIAALTTAPFTAALLMPDIFAPAVLLALLLLAFAREAVSRAEAWGLGLVAAIGIAAHLSHLPLAAAIIALALLLTRRLAPALRATAPLMGAVLILLATNFWGHGRAVLSAEAGEIVAVTLRTHPVEVAQAMLRNMLVQIVTATAGDTLVADHLAAAVRPRIAEGFPARELAAYDAALQPRGRMPDAAAAFLWPHAPVLVLGAGLALLGWWRAARRHDLRQLGLVVGVLVGVTANAFATGALSKPHLRYEARILWLMPVVAALALLPRRP